jgi:hypothetical protein
MPGVPPCPFVRAVWDGLIALGLLHAVGQSDGRLPPGPTGDALRRDTRTGCGPICRCPR